MEFEKIITYIETSFLETLLREEDITDITYNGEDIFYMHNLYGRKRSDIKINEQEVKDFLRQVANICEKQFSAQNPYLDVSFGRYRLNAVHQSIGRKKGRSTVSFSIRIASITPKITDKSDFLNKPLIDLFRFFINNGFSIVIGGITGCGKTEFQKYLISKFADNTRVIVIDNVLELAQIQNDSLDITCWQADDRNLSESIQILVKNALRSNPDWVIIAESRGPEMLEILNSCMSGHPIITTLHSQSAESIPNRIARMILMNDKKMDIEGVLNDIYFHIHIYVYLKKKIEKSGSVRRYINSIYFIDSSGKKIELYKNENNLEKYKKMPESLSFLVDKRKYGNDFITKFVGDNDEK